ncbi:MAG: hypothetical protein FRX48_04237 [Lasallia pustulata]|uniref:Ubiquitin-like domain-containing protein n=1 Tax=Lasallia pustulata TaxID=136370 RepID=A0A5M8PRP1_9LECA|nr:MAG: hypothetical protein FRX48_04237 [Lasallia pustulata]
MDTNEASSTALADGSGAQTIVLHVLSPSTEVPKKLTFSSVPTSTTVGELKLKIRDAVATKPAPERQRLIYRGKALTNNVIMLRDVFGQDTIDSAEPLSLHLVLPPTAENPYPPSSVSSSRPRPASSEFQALTPPRPASSGFQAPTPPRPASTGQLPTNAPHVRPMPGQGFMREGTDGAPPPPAMPWQNMQVHQGPLSPHTAQHLNHHLAALTQQLGLPFPMPGMNNSPGLPHNQNQTGPWQQPPHMNPSFHQTLAQQQQARAAAGLDGVGNLAGDLHQRAESPMIAQQRDQSTTPGDGQGPRDAGNTTTIVREGQGPHGAHWRMTINGSIATFPGIGSNFNGGMNGGERAMPNSSIISPHGPTAEPTGTPNMRQPLRSLGSSSTEQTAANLIERQSQHIRNSLAQMQQRASSLEQNTPREGLGPTQIARPSNLTMRAEQARTPTGVNESNTIAESSTAASTSTTSPSPMVYLLSSPSGPRALLMTHSEMYTTPFLGVSSINGGSHAIFHHGPGIAAQATATGRDDAINGQPVLAQSAQHGEVVAQPQQQQPQQEVQPNPARDIFRIVLPLGGHVWLLIRLFGFVYFFTSGAGWRRTILLGLCAILVFVAQTGVFRPLQQTIWEPLRRHVEGLMPVAGNNPPNADGRAARGDSVTERGNAGGQGELDPREVADRLLREQRNRDGDFIRRNLRRAERAVAFFLASLVPGVGERHIAARDAAEAERLAAERAAQERAQREAEEAARPQDGTAAGTRDEGNSAEAGGASPSGEAQGSQQQQQQQPLIEI